ncbi:MAG: hypothetical protein JNK70_09235 [Phycisphaerae bacterium]|nr:hypothetical protein [Phycisphaerae bacterium]
MIHHPPRDTAIRLSRAASGIMAVVWIGSGAWKATHPANFAEIVRGHGVVPGLASEIQAVAPLIEIAAAGKPDGAVRQVSSALPICHSSSSIGA